MQSDRAGGETFDSVEYLLFDSLVHHLIEKGLFSKNDALDVVQTVAEVVRGQVHECNATNEKRNAALSLLERTYSSYQALHDRHGRPEMDGHNVHPLRPPLHNDSPHFPSDDD